MVLSRLRLSEGVVAMVAANRRWKIAELILGLAARGLILPLVVAKVVLLTWSPQPHNFYAGWLSLAVFLACRASLRSSRAQPWTSTWLPLLASFALVLSASLLAHAFFHEPSVRHLLSFVIVSVAFFLLTITWIVVFPFGKGLIGWTPRRVSAWRIISGMIGACLGVLIVHGGARLFLSACSAGLVPLDLLVFQSRAVQGSILIYFFLVIRYFLPQASAEIIGVVDHGHSAPGPRSGRILTSD
jgi:hypothetical protein